MLELDSHQLACLGQRKITKVYKAKDQSQASTKEQIKNIMLKETQTSNKRRIC